MADPVSAFHLLRNVGEQNLLRDSVQPSPIDAEMSRIVTTKEWARIAGSCRASWRLQFQQVDLRQNTPVEGLLKKWRGGMSQESLGCCKKSLESASQHSEATSIGINRAAASRSPISAEKMQGCIVHIYHSGGRTCSRGFERNLQVWVKTGACETAEDHRYPIYTAPAQTSRYTSTYHRLDTTICIH